MAKDSTPYSVEVSSSAAKQLKKLAKRNRDALKAIDAAIFDLAANPRMNGVEQLTNEDHLFRYRVGEFRIVFAINDKARLVVILRVKARKDVYRKK